MELSPCDQCQFRHHCASMHTACHAFVAFSRHLEWDDRPREPTRVDFLRATEDLRIQQCFQVIARVKRDAKAAGRKPTFAEMVKALDVDARATAELIDRYKSKQGMIGELVE